MQKNEYQNRSILTIAKGLTSGESTCNSNFSNKHSRACASISDTRTSRTCGFKSMEGAFVKVSYMCRKTPAARKKLSTAESSPFSDVRSCLAPICV